jgi:hypothetical protein
VDGDDREVDVDSEIVRKLVIVVNNGVFSVGFVSVVKIMDPVENDDDISVNLGTVTSKLDAAAVEDKVVLSAVCWTVVNEEDPVPVVATFMVVKM